METTTVSAVIAMIADLGNVGILLLVLYRLDKMYERILSVLIDVLIKRVVVSEQGNDELKAQLQNAIHPTTNS